MIGQRQPRKLPPCKQPKLPLLCATHFEFTLVLFCMYFASNKCCLSFAILVSWRNSFFKEEKDWSPSSKPSTAGTTTTLHLGFYIYFFNPDFSPEYQAHTPTDSWASGGPMTPQTPQVKICLISPLSLSASKEYWIMVALTHQTCLQIWVPAYHWVFSPLTLFNHHVYSPAVITWLSHSSVFPPVPLPFPPP